MCNEIKCTYEDDISTPPQREIIKRRSNFFTREKSVNIKMAFNFTIKSIRILLYFTLAWNALR